MVVTWQMHEMLCTKCFETNDMAALAPSVWFNYRVELICRIEFNSMAASIAYTLSTHIK